METIKDTQSKIDIRDSDSSFEQEISENDDNNKSSSNFEPSDKFKNEESENIFRDKNLEEAEINEIYDLLNKIELVITLDKSTLEKNDYYIKSKRRSYSFESKRNKKNKQHFNECEEILSILKKPLSDKNLKGNNIFNIPFKPLLKPKKVSLEGKVIYNIISENYTTESSSENY